MRPVKLLQPDLDLLAGNVDAAHEPDHLALLLCRHLDLLHLRVEPGQLLQELVAAGHGLELLGDQALHRERRGRLDGQAAQARQDGQLARHVQPVEVVARVRLRVPQLLGFLDRGGPLAPGALGGRERVEEERHGAAEDALDARHLVARVDQVLERRDDGEPGAAARLVVDLGAGGGGGGEDVLPELVAAREGLLVGRDDADAPGEELRVRVGDVLAAGVVDQDGPGAAGGGGEVLGDLGQGEGGADAVGLELRGGGGDVDGRVVGAVEGLGGGGDVAEDELGVRAALGELLELGEEALSYATGAWGGWMEVLVLPEHLDGGLA